MFHLSAQNRSWQVKFLLDLVYAFVTRKHWDPATVVVTHKGKTGPSNMFDVIKSIFTEEGKVFDLAGKKVTTGEILSKAELFDKNHGKQKFPVLLEGRHRAVAMFLVSQFHGIDIKPNVSEVNDEMAKRVSMEANLTNEQFAKLLNTEKLGGIVQAIRDGIYSKQTDIPVKRGQQQTLWHRAQAVIVQGLSLDDAIKLSYKEAKEVTEGKLTAEAAIAARAGNEVKVLPGSKIRDLATMIKNYDPEGSSPLAQLVNAIVSNAETTAKSVIVTAYTVGKN